MNTGRRTRFGLPGVALALLAACGGGSTRAADPGPPDAPSPTDTTRDPGPPDPGSDDQPDAMPLDAVEAADAGPPDGGPADQRPADPGPPDLGPVQACTVQWVAIPGGTFRMGARDEDYATPVHAVAVPGFEMARTEVTVCQYAACVAAGACSSPQCGQGADGDPVVCVDWDQSRAYCAWGGGRLCSEAEWEYAARNGAAGSLYPWGDAAPACDDAVFTDSFLGCVAPGTSPACSTPEGDDAWGVCDLGGNVWECLEDDWHDDYTLAPADGSAWVDSPRASDRVYRGGSFYYDSYGLRGSARAYDYPTYSGDYVGIRCCRTPP